jgi:hypothetical protein
MPPSRILQQRPAVMHNTVVPRRPFTALSTTGLIPAATSPASSIPRIQYLANGANRSAVPIIYPFHCYVEWWTALKGVGEPDLYRRVASYIDKF